MSTKREASMSKLPKKAKKGKKDKRGKGKKEESAKAPPAQPAAQQQGAMNEPSSAPESPVSFFVGDTRLQLTHAKLLEDSQFSDVVFSFPKAKKQTVHAHKVILATRVPALLVPNKFISKLALKKGKFETTVNAAALPFMAPTVLRWVLKFAYSGVLKVQMLPIPSLLDLTATATTLGINDLKWHCEHAIRGHLNGDTVHVILRGADDRNLEDVKKIALAFSFSNWDSFIGNKEGAKILGLELFQAVSSDYASGNKVEAQEEPEPTNEILADYRRIYENLTEPDLAIIAGAEKIPCHRAILAMYSRELAMGLKNVKLTHGNPQPFQLSDRLQSAQAVDSFLRFVYYGESKMDPLDASEMIAHVNSRFRLNTFQLLCEHTIINGISVKSAVSTLGVTYIQPLNEKPHIKALREQTVAFIIGNFGSIDLNPLRELPPIIQTDLLFQLQAVVKKGQFEPNRASTTVSASGQSVSESTHDTGAMEVDEVDPGEPAKPIKASEEVPTLQNVEDEGEVAVGASSDGEPEEEEVTTV